MATNGYTVLVDEYTVLQQVGELRDPINGNLIGIQQGKGKVYFKDEVIPENEVSPLTVEALDNEDHPSHAYVSKRLAKTDGKAKQNLAARLGLPFAGYDEMSEDQVLETMRNLPSSTIGAIKRYEAEEGPGRDRILNYNVGFGESATDRQEGRAGSDLDVGGRLASDKDVADLTTREVPEEGVVQVGDGITGTGDPQIPHGSRKDEEDEVSEDEKPKVAARRSRRQRSGSTKKPASKSEGSGNDGDK